MRGGLRKQAMVLTAPSGGIEQAATPLASRNIGVVAPFRLRSVHDSGPETVFRLLKCNGPQHQSRPVAVLRSLRQCHDGEASRHCSG
jgi:hypothetical protein